MIPVLNIGYPTRTREEGCGGQISGCACTNWTHRRSIAGVDGPPWSHPAGRACTEAWQRSPVLMANCAGASARSRASDAVPRRAPSASRSPGFRADGVSFLGLWGGTLAIYGLTRCELLTERTPSPSADEDAILLRLDRHLVALSQGLGLPEPAPQLPLFPAVSLKSSSDGRLSVGRRTEAGRS